MYNTKKILTFFSIFLASYGLIRSVIEIQSPFSVKTDYIGQILYLIIVLFVVIKLGTLFSQKNWRIAYLMIGLNVILDRLGMVTSFNLRRVLYAFSILVVLFGLVNLFLFYKSDFEPDLKITKEQMQKGLLFAMFIIVVVAIIFLVFSWTL